MNIYVMIGIPGSGKSTWVKNNKLACVSRDIIREELGIVEHGEKGVGSSSQENQVTKLENKRISELINNGKDFAIDDMNTGKYRKDLLSKLRSEAPNAKIIGVVIQTALETCIKRRENQIPSVIMRRMNSFRVEPSIEEGFDEIIKIKGE